MQSQCLIDILIEFLNLAFLIDVFIRRFQLTFLIDVFQAMNDARASLRRLMKYVVPVMVFSGLIQLIISVKHKNNNRLILLFQLVDC